MQGLCPAIAAKRLRNGKTIIIMWPYVPTEDNPFVELYFNERLVKYPASFLGHLAVNVSGEIFNFSHMINENEAMECEDYFFRPALGEFAPHPITGRDNLDDPEKPYYDKFGRLFMRTIHVLRIEGLDTKKLANFFHDQLDIILNTPPNPKEPGKYAKFNIFTRSCSTIIRDGFHDLGYKIVRGTFPRELFVNISYFFLKQDHNASGKVSRRTLKQLHVPEAAPSVMPPLLNPLNRYKDYHLRK